jgi:hypothetical protein
MVRPPSEEMFPPVVTVVADNPLDAVVVRIGALGASVVKVI